MLAAVLAPGLLAGCTGSDMSMGIDMAGPIPPATIGGGGGTYGAPSVGAAEAPQTLAMGYGGLPAPVPVTPIEKMPADYQPPAQNQPVTYSDPPQQQMAATQLPAAPQSSAPIQSGPLLAPPSQPPAQPQTSQGDPSYSAQTMPPVQQPANDYAASQPAPPSAPASPVQTAPVETYPSQSNASPPQETQIAAQTRSVREVQFLPLVGAPDNKANLLAQALADEAARSQITIRAAADGRADARLKGYFSTFEDGGETVLVYVWDVLDPNDERIHRIQGQERFAATGSSEAWSGVDRAVLDRVARTTLQEASKLSPAAG